MTAPAVALRCLLIAFLLGFPPGLLHSFLRPLRLRHRHLCDLCSVAALCYCWIYLGFGICGGDLRMGYLLGLLSGWALCICTVGKWLQGLFSRFFHFLGRLFGGFRGIIGKFFAFFKKIVKVLFAFHKK